jgi:sec-independent protein translocase protein TatC
MSEQATEGAAPLIAHLIELKTRLIRGLLVWLLATGLCYYFAQDIYRFLMAPLAEIYGAQSGQRMIATGLAETFVTYIRLAVYGGFFLGFPVIAAQIYLFVAPGLYKHERRVMGPYLAIAPLLFIAGAAFAYYLVIPKAWAFFTSFQMPATDHSLPLVVEAKVSEYLSLVMQIIMAFGLSFQLPILLTLLVRTGLTTTRTLARGRRYAVVILLGVAAFITPPDVLSQVMLFIPLYGLYEISIIIGKTIEKKRDAAMAYEEMTHA